MGKRERHAPGTLSWVDLGTTDPDGAKTFYGALFGWQAEDLPTGEAGTYTMLRLDGDDVAGLYRQGEEQQAAGVPPSWLVYVTVGRAGEAVARVGALGGTLVAEPFDVMDSGRMAVIQDPTGATLALWEPRSHIGAQRVNDPGCLCWADLVTPDPAAAERFYAGLLGWEVEQMPDAGGYRVINNAGRSNGGMMPTSMAGGDVPPHWLPYFNAGDLDDVTARMGEAGGRVVADPRQVPAGRFCVAQDPQSAAFALLEGPVDD